MLKYIRPGKSLPFYLALMALIGLSVIFAKYTFSSKSSCQITFAVNTPAPVEFTIYYDIGRGLIEKDRQSKFVNQINEKTVVSFCIPTYSKLRSLRFDPATGPISMKIYDVTLQYSNGEVFRVPFDAIKANEQIKIYRERNTHLYFETIPTANDPSFTLTRLREKEEPGNVIPKTLHFMKWLTGALAFMFFGRFFYTFFFKGL